MGKPKRLPGESKRQARERLRADCSNIETATEVDFPPDWPIENDGTAENVPYAGEPAAEAEEV